MQTSLDTNVALFMLQLTTEISIKPLDLKFRLHTYLGREPWAKLWYALRSLDQSGSGYYELPIELAEMLTGGDEKTIYRWLKEGRSLGAFRRYKVRKGILKVWLGGLFAVCERMNLRNWGAVAVVNLLDLKDVRGLTTATATQFLQEKSRYAANKDLKSDYRKLYGAPEPNQLLGEVGESSLQMGVGQIPFLLHISESRLFVSKSFTAFGISQRAISINLGIHPKTVQRHQVAIGMVSRQICQSKLEYGWIIGALNHEIQSYDATSTARSEGLGYQITGDTVTYRDGFVPGGKRSEPNSWNIPEEEFSGRFFKMGGKWWLAKCNIYREELTLTTMRAARKKYRQKLSQCQFQSEAVGGGGDVYTKVARQPRT